MYRHQVKVTQWYLAKNHWVAVVGLGLGFELKLESRLWDVWNSCLRRWFDVNIKLSSTDLYQQRCCSAWAASDADDYDRRSRLQRPAVTNQATYCIASGWLISHTCLVTTRVRITTPCLKLWNLDVNDGGHDMPQSWDITEPTGFGGIQHFPDRFHNRCVQRAALCISERS